MRNKLLQSLALVSGLLAGADAWAATAAAPAAQQPAGGVRLHTDKGDLASTAPAAEPVTIKKTEIANFDFWRLQCDQFSDAKMGKRCVARMPVYKANGQQLLAMLVIGQDEANKDWQLKVIIPTSISVQDGATIAFESGGKPQNFPIDTCEPQACASNLPLDAAMQDALKASNKVTLSWITIDHSPIKFDFEIKGIQQTMKALFG